MGILNECSKFVNITQPPNLSIFRITHWMPFFIAQVFIILAMIRMVSRYQYQRYSISRMFHDIISLILVLLLLLLNSVSGFRLEFMCICQSQRKYLPKPYLFPWFSVSCIAAIAYRNPLFLTE